jgi:glycosyltransferase involved in cell wall biosynthesis
VPERTWVNATIVGDRPTGLGVYASGLIEALAGQGEELAVITAHGPPLRGAAATLAAPRAVRPEGGTRAHVARVAWLQTALPRMLARARPSLLLNVVPEGPLWCPVPQVTIVHDLIPLLYPAEFPRFPRAYLYFRVVVPRLLRASRAVIADSEHTRRDVLARYRGISADRVHVAHAAYDRSRFFASAPAAPARPPYLLYVGNIAPHKNLIRLVDAFAVAAPRTVTLAIRGSGRARYVASVRRRIDELGLAARIDWRPYEAASTLPDLYRGARALVLPSLYEGFGLTALEAMACGTPVIATRAASVPEVVGDAAYAVDPFDVGALAGAMTEILANDDLARDLRERGLARATLFSWDRTAREVRAHLHAPSAR